MLNTLKAKTVQFTKHSEKQNNNNFEHPHLKIKNENFINVCFTWCNSEIAL